MRLGVYRPWNVQGDAELLFTVVYVVTNTLKRTAAAASVCKMLLNKMNSKLERRWTYRRLYIINGTRYGLGTIND